MSFERASSEQYDFFPLVCFEYEIHRMSYVCLQLLSHGTEVQRDSRTRRTEFPPYYCILQIFNIYLKVRYGKKKECVNEH